MASWRGAGHTRCPGHWRAHGWLVHGETQHISRSFQSGGRTTCPKKFLLKDTVFHHFKLLTFSQEILWITGISRMMPKGKRIPSLFPLTHKPAHIMNTSVFARHLSLTTLPAVNRLFLIYSKIKIRANLSLSFSLFLPLEASNKKNGLISSNIPYWIGAYVSQYIQP